MLFLVKSTYFDLQLFITTIIMSSRCWLFVLSINPYNSCSQHEMKAIFVGLLQLRITATDLSTCG